MKNLDGLSNAQGLDESITENYTNYCGDDYSNIDWKDPFKGLRKNVKDAGQNIKNTTKEIGQNIQRTTKEIGQNIKSTTKDIGKNIGNTLGGGKAVHAVNKFNPVFIQMRGAVLGILNKNVVGMSDALYLIKEDSDKSAWEKMMQKWWMWGGEKSKFDKAVMKGKGQKPLFKDVVEKFQKKKGFDGEYSYANSQQLSNAGDVVLVASSLLGVASAALAAGTATAPAAPYVGIGGAAFGSMGGILKSFAKNKGASEEKINDIPETADIPNAAPPTDAKELERINKEIEDNVKAGVEDDGSGSEKLEEERKSGRILGIPKTPFWIGVSVLGIVAGIVIYKKFIKK